MKRLASLPALALGLVLLTGTASAADLSKMGGTLVPAGFCHGQRFDGQLYGPFIDLNALTQYEAAQMSDPVTREAARRAKSTTWKTEVRKGQTQKCGKASF